MAEENIEDLKKLPPEQRLKKLKELAEKRKQEIEEAQRLMKASEEELTQTKRLEEKIPIPQIAAEAMEALETEEEREMFRTHRDIKGKEKPKPPTPKPTKGEREEEKTLEETVEKEAPQRELPTERPYGAILETSKKPIEYFSNFFQEIRQKTYDVGGLQNLPTEDRLRFEYANAGWEKKLEAIETGRYEPESRATLREAVLTEHMRHKLQSMYHSQAAGTERAPGQEHEFKEFEEEPKYRRAA